MHEELIQNEKAVSQHRHLDKFSGYWNECKFSGDICKKLLAKTNVILKDNGVKQQVGIRQIDPSSNEEDYFSNI